MFVKIPNYICCISLTVILILNLACNKYSEKEKLISDYLNKNESSFDKKSFELVQLEPLDTIMAHEIYKIDAIPGYIDSVGASPPYTMNWEVEDYPLKLYSTLINPYEYSSNNYFDQMESFFNEYKIISEKDFEKELMNNSVFVDSLRIKMGYYAEPFTGCFDSDSLNKYIGISKTKRETLYGYLYLLKFRTKDELKTRKLLFDSENQILRYKAIEN
jgi:hypothetical protein